MSMQIFIEKRNAEPAPVTDGPYGEHLEEMRLVALDLIELLARERPEPLMEWAPPFGSNPIAC